jgi:hypothetical protein
MLGALNESLQATPDPYSLSFGGVDLWVHTAATKGEP